MRRRATEVVLAACAAAVVAGCGSVDHLVYVSETSLGVSVNAAAQGTPKVAVGYDRETFAVVPRVDSACEPKREAMSLVAVSDIDMAGIDELVFNHYIATGRAAAEAAKDPAGLARMRAAVFGEASGNK